MLLLRYLKSYLPAHSILRGFVALHLCDFADAIRAGCAEAKNHWLFLLSVFLSMQSMRDVLRQSVWDGSLHPVRVMQSVRDVLRQRNSVLTRGGGGDEMQSVRDVPKRTEGHCIQTIMRRIMK